MAFAGAPGHLHASSSALRPSAAPFFAITRNADGQQAMRCNVGMKIKRSSLGFMPLVRAVRPTARIRPAMRALPNMDSVRNRNVICEPCSTSAGNSMLASPLRAQGCHPNKRGLRRVVAAAGGAAPLLACLSSVSVDAAPLLAGDAVLKGALTGLMAGCLHTLAGPDHLAGLTPLTLGRGPLAAGALGSLWGLGHGSGQLVLGLVMILANERFHRFAPVLEQWGSVVVGAMLLGVGLMGFWEMWTEHEHSHGHHLDVAAPCLNSAPAGTPPRFAYDALVGKENDGALAASSRAKKERRGLLKTFAVGIVYGLQPDALFVIVPALTLPSRSVAAAYVAAFVGGTVLAMGGYAMLLGLASTSLAARVPDLNRYLSIAASSTAIAVALYILAPSLGIVLPF